MPTVFKSAGITLSATTPSDVWTGTTGAQTLVTSLNVTNTTGTATRADVFLFNATNGAKRIGAWTLNPIGTQGCTVCCDRVAIIAGDKIQLSNTSGVALDAVISVSETT